MKITDNLYLNIPTCTAFLVRFTGIVFYLLINFSLVAQDVIISKEIGFVTHLINNSRFAEAEKAADILSKHNINVSQRDSLNYYKGFAQFQMDSFSNATATFSTTSPLGNLYYPSMFYVALSLSKSSRFEQAFSSLTKTGNFPLKYQSFASYTLASYALLNRNYSCFDSIASEFNFNDQRYSNEEKQLLGLRIVLKQEKRKKPVIAGLLSAVVPGLGKYYAGYRRQSITSFIPTVIYGVCAYESYYRMGGFASKPDLRILPFVTFSTVFTVFYIGNIIGSVKSVNTMRIRNHNKINHEIIEGLTNAHQRVLQ